MTELLSPDDIGVEMHHLIRELYPICRSITGDGVRQTLRIVQQHIPLVIHEVPTGVQLFDWTTPREWNVHDAYVANVHGERVIDFRASNLHLLNYSTPLRARVSREELHAHLFTLPEQPDLIPYRTSYYTERWGFCVSHAQAAQLTDPYYDVVIDASLEVGHLTYGELVIPGASQDEVFFSTHCCHPSLCNDNLSGIALCTWLAKYIASLSARRYTYRFVFIPGTIGAIAWLALHEAETMHIRHGLVVACVGDPGSLHYKKSRRGDAEIDRVVQHVLRWSGAAYAVRDFSPYGYDERQYCSPGFDLPVGSLTRTPHGCYPEYHTSADDLTLVQPPYLADSLQKYIQVVETLEHNRRYLNLNPKCEPQLGRRGLYSALGGRKHAGSAELAMLWVLNLSDGEHTLLDIAERANLPFDDMFVAAQLLVEHDLLREV